MASPSELSLDCKPHSYSMLLKSFGDQTDQTQKLEDFLTRLEEERLKIDAFKRELPLCMQLLTSGTTSFHPSSSCIFTSLKYPNIQQVWGIAFFVYNFNYIYSQKSAIDFSFYKFSEKKKKSIYTYHLFDLCLHLRTYLSNFVIMI
jgi:hypothetical protein